MATQPDLNSNDGWIEWTGGECPVIPGTKVETLARDGFRVSYVVEGDQPEAAWQHLPDCYPQWDIIAYRVVSA